MALTATVSKSIEGASRYFDEALSQGDYYTADASIKANWHGRLTQSLGLDPNIPVTADQFKRLLSGLHPETGKKLVQRLRKDRRPGFDLTFSCPKSVSLAFAILEDNRIKDVLRDAVKETMERDVEPLMNRRVRNGKNVHSQNQQRTGTMLWADFLHTTSRPVEGKSDPHLHIHAFIMNLTQDADGTIYAAEPEQVFRQRQALQSMFEARLARKLKDVLGYDITASTFSQSGKLKRGWELAGIKRSTIERFSRRTEQIESFAKENGITDAAKKGELGAKVRDKKIKDASAADLHKEWQSRITPGEGKAFEALRAGAIGKKPRDLVLGSAEAAVEYSLQHHLYRQSTAEKHVIVSTALEHAVTATPEEINAALDAHDVIQKSTDVRGISRPMVTTPDVLETEEKMIAFARDSRGTRMAIGRDPHVFKQDWLDDGQKAAVNHVIESRDSVMAIIGSAGTGKTSLMSEAAAAIEANGKKVYTFSPSTAACEVLEEKGFKNAKTVEHLLRNEKLHPELQDQVIWVDEASLLDVRSMNGVFAIARKQNCRVVLSGDPKQHSSPRRGESFRLLEREAGLNIARVEKVQRQKGKYKRIAEMVSLGHSVIDHKTGLTGLLAGWDALDKLGKIKEQPAEEKHTTLAKRYMKARKTNKSTLIVSPTHAEKNAVTETIRNELRQSGAIGREGVDLQRLKSLNWSEAQKGERSSYDSGGMVVEFHQNVKGGFVRGERYRVVKSAAGDTKLVKLTGGKAKTIPLQAAENFEVYNEEKLEVSVGDKVRFTLGGKSLHKASRISNGRLDTIERFEPSGNLVLSSGMVVSKDYGHLDHGYVVSSHASQGKDASLAIAAMGSESLAAINARQFYVTITRGAENCEIYVDDKKAVRRAISQAGDQMSATELVQANQERALRHHRDRQHRAFLDRVRDWWKQNMTQRQNHTKPLFRQQPVAGYSPSLKPSR